MSKTSVIQIPESLHKELSRALEGSVFTTVDNLAAFILQRYLDSENEKAETTPEEDENAVKERLRNLGYL